MLGAAALLSPYSGCERRVGVPLGDPTAVVTAPVLLLAARISGFATGSSHIGTCPRRVTAEPGSPIRGSGDPKLTNFASGTSMRVLEYLHRLPHCRSVIRVHAWLRATMVCTVTATTSQTRMPNCRSIRMRMSCDPDLCIGGRPRCSWCSAAVCWGPDCVSQGKLFDPMKVRDGRGRRS